MSKNTISIKFVESSSKILSKSARFLNVEKATPETSSRDAHPSREMIRYSVEDMTCSIHLLYVCVYIYIHIYIYIHNTYVLHVCVHIYIYICLLVCMYVIYYIDLYIYIYNHV